jgi:hypothetical protein
MSTKDATRTGAWTDRVPRAPKREQTPWQRPEDAEGWTTVHVGKGEPRPPVGARLAVSLTADQMRWVEERAQAIGLDVFAFMAKLVDDARTAERRTKPPMKKIE